MDPLKCLEKQGVVSSGPSQKIAGAFEVTYGAMIEEGGGDCVAIFCGPHAMERAAQYRDFKFSGRRAGKRMAHR